MKFTKKEIKYIITGVDMHGKRCKKESSNFLYINMINIYRGSIWKKENNKRTLIKRIYN